MNVEFGSVGSNGTYASINCKALMNRRYGCGLICGTPNPLNPFDALHPERMKRGNIRVRGSQSEFDFVTTKILLLCFQFFKKIKLLLGRLKSQTFLPMRKAAFHVRTQHSL